MQILRDLSDLCKKASAAIADETLKLQSLRQEAERTIMTKDKLEADIQGALEQLRNVNLKISEEKAREISLIQQKTDESSALKLQLESELARAKVQSADYAKKLEDITKQQQALNDMAANLTVRETALNDKLATFQSMARA